jgi:hypothetical protein
MKKISLLMSLTALLISSQSFSAETTAPVWEFYFTNLASLNLGFNSTPGSSSTTSINLFNNSGTNVLPGMTFGRVIFSNLEVVLSPAMVYVAGTNGGSSTTGLNATAGFNYSFMPVMEEAFFLQAQAGILYLSSGGSSTSTFTWNASIGKRFQIVNHVEYVPAVTYNWYNTTYATSTLSIVPLQFSVLF